jgi:hypothetical protein
MELKNKDHSTKLAAFMRARHSIYLSRKAGVSYPWTTDPILSAYRFCNVYRELDVVTIWVRENIREPYAEHPQLAFLLGLARQINHPETLAEIFAEANPAKRWDPERVRRVMNARAARGEKVYTGAYMLYGGNNASLGTERDKPNFTTKIVLDPLYRARKVTDAAAAKSMEAAHRHLSQFQGWGGFMAYEVVCDMRYTRYGENWSDINTFAHAGPGAVRGLNRLHGRELKFGLKAGDALQEMIELLAGVRKLWPKTRDCPRLELREIEHSLCEYDKYERVRLGQGTPRSLYKPALPTGESA